MSDEITKEKETEQTLEDTEGVSEESQTDVRDNEVMQTILKTLEELRDKQPAQGPQKSVPTPEELLKMLEEDRGTQPPVGRGPKDLEEMTMSELAQYIFEVVQREVAYPLMQKVEVLRVNQEVDKCEKKYPDFWDYRQEIWQIASNNPSLSIEQAYLLAKSQNPKQTAPRPDTSNATSVTSLNAKKVASEQPKPSAVGDKPGVSGAAMRRSNVKSLREAAAMAWNEIMSEGGK